ncbi:hypothetical protein [Limnochorda pilosa]|uniref:Uncharacterized protein n=1 Tax=Limnochorda pilosa TaxID=1555112 RepID=A0A0K2SIK4_LIMPI|nr:hypothetical protein [Limnochorda pilosa]BAS26943.1 hypothetical protein LIP_1086 [Limnochorda pilosa]
MAEAVCPRCGKPANRCLCDVLLVARNLGAAIYRVEPENILVVIVPLEKAVVRDGAPPGFPRLVTYCVDAVVEGAAVFDEPADASTVDDELLYRMGPSEDRGRVAGVIAELLAGEEPPEARPARAGS